MLPWKRRARVIRDEALRSSLVKCGAWPKRVLKLPARSSLLLTRSNPRQIAPSSPLKRAPRRSVEGVELATNAGRSLESILEVVAENTSAANEISIATQQQKSASEQVVVAMTNIAEASKQQASGARQTAAATEQLNRAAELREAIARFKVK